NSNTGTGGAIGAPGNAVATLGTVNITRCKFLSNTSSGFGGGLGLDDSPGAVVNGWHLTVTDSTFDGNTGSTNGGGIFIRIPHGSLTVTGSTFSNNKALNFGAAISLLTAPSDTVTIRNCTFTGNTAPSTSAGTLGVGSVLSNGGGNNGLITFQNCTLSGNS